MAEWFEVFCQSSAVFRDGHFRTVYYSKIAKPNPEYRILFWFFPAMHCPWELLKKRRSVKNQGGPHSALSLIQHWKSTIYLFITQTFSQHWTTNFLILMQWCIFFRQKWLHQERPDIVNTF